MRFFLRSGLFLLLAVFLSSCSSSMEVQNTNDDLPLFKENLPTIDRALLSQYDSDGDLLNDAVDPCPSTNLNDQDGDGVCEEIQGDINGDGCVNLSDYSILSDEYHHGASGGESSSLESDLVPDGVINLLDVAVMAMVYGQCRDNCPITINPDQKDSNQDGVGDACEVVCQGLLCSDSLPKIPKADEWTDHGVVLSSGKEGEWDLYLWGGFAASAVKKDGVYYLYYQGSNGYDEQEATVTYRSIGVATSIDGIRFEKYSNNPVLTYLPSNHLEEGAVSCGAFVDSDHRVQMYYGANTATSSGLVKADGRLASSDNALDFQDTGRILNSASSSVWGYGDELFPVIGFQEGDRFYSYYIPNGTAQKGYLGVAYGPGILDLHTTEGVQAGGNLVQAWGPGAAVRLSSTQYAIFITSVADQHASGRHLDVYTVDLSSPGTLVGPVVSYSFSDFNAGTLLLDRDVGKWFLYYRNGNASSYRVMTAPLSFQE